MFIVLTLYIQLKYLKEIKAQGNALFKPSILYNLKYKTYISLQTHTFQFYLYSEGSHNRICSKPDNI